MCPNTNPRAIPKVGRYRLFRWDGPRLRCKACRKLIKLENQWRHWRTEVARHGGEAALAERLAFLGRARRSRRHLARLRYVWVRGRDP